MADVQNEVVLAWHGVDGDTQTWWAKTEPVPISGPLTIQPHENLGITSSVGPALDSSAHLLAYVEGTLPPLITLRRPNTSGDFIPTGTRAGLKNALTDARPAVDVAYTDDADSVGKIVLAWRAANGDILVMSTQRPILKTRLPAEADWSERVKVGESAHGPAVAAHAIGDQFHFLVAFQGESDQIWGSIDAQPDKKTGRISAPINPTDGGIFTSHSPALCYAAGRFWMAWKGNSDKKIWLSSTHTTALDGWTAPRQAAFIDATINTIDGPGLAVCQASPDQQHPNPPQTLVLAWRGVTGDQALWWSTRPIPPAGHELELDDKWEVPHKVDPSDNSNAGPSVGSRPTHPL